MKGTHVSKKKQRRLLRESRKKAVAVREGQQVLAPLKPLARSLLCRG